MAVVAPPHMKWYQLKGDIEGDVNIFKTFFIGIAME